MRLFFAVPLSPEQVEQVSEAAARLRRSLEKANVKVRWTPVSQLHVTLKFLGETSPAAAESVLRLDGLALDPFEMAFEGWGSFASTRSSVIWIAIPQGGRELSAVASALEDFCATGGVARERRPYHPHLTVARVPDPPRGISLQQTFERAPCPATLPAFVKEVVLMESFLGGPAPRYEIRKRVPLNRADSVAGRSPS